MNPVNFFVELKRRNVYRVAAAYGVVAWFLTQLTTQVFPFFDMPTAAIRFVVIALALGFPIAMCLSWLYELTPEGIVRSEDLDPVIARSARRVTGRILDFIIIGVLLLVIAMLIYQRGASRNPAGESIPEKSIAVLPFENLSAEKDDAFFADGIQDDVLNSLGKIKELTVIARASVMAYRGTALGGKLREIGKTLGVSHVLAGSVRRSANRVVVSVQLIDTRDDHQLWSERYERTISDALSLQGELAVQIARELRATLTPAEQSVVATKPTENPDAYVLYLRARELQTRWPNGDYDAAVKLYQQAIDLDPKFALARARLSLGITEAKFAGGERGSDAEQRNALTEAEEALRLNPNLGEGRLALAAYHMAVEEAFDAALAELVHAEELLPNSAEVWRMRGKIYKRQNKLRERIAAFQRAETLDPRETESVVRLAFTFENVREWSEAIRTFERVRALVPSNGRPFWPQVWAEFHLHGVIDPLKKAVEQAPSTAPPSWETMTRYQIAMLERDYGAAEGFLREIPPETFHEQPLMAHPKSMNEALLAVARGADSEAALLTARQEVEQQLNAPNMSSTALGEIGLIDAFLGRKEDAIREGRRFVEEPHYSMLEKNDAAANLALIYARTGEPDEAIKLIEQLLTAPANLEGLWVFTMTQADLKWRWVWDPLRNDPRFQKILEGLEPKTIY